MPSVIGHLAVPLCLGAALGRNRIAGSVTAAGTLLAVLPDLDVLAFRLGIPYQSPFGHRGFSHSLLFAAATALCCTLMLAATRHRRLRSWLFLFAAAASHPLLDAATDGGLGVALLWPLSEQRLVAPFRPIAVSPIGLERFFSPRGLAVLRSELVWLWLPCGLVAAWSLLWRRARPAWSR